MYNAIMIQKPEVEKQLTLLPDKAVSQVAREVIRQAEILLLQLL
ncbi:hypothetical protein [Pantoea sp. B65]